MAPIHMHVLIVMAIVYNIVPHHPDRYALIALQIINEMISYIVFDY